jgi:hypothetical protein
MSTTYGQNNAFRAVNGDTRYFYAHTQPGDVNGWWQVDLGQRYTIKNIKVWGRNNCVYDCTPTVKFSPILMGRRIFLFLFSSYVSA